MSRGVLGCGDAMTYVSVLRLVAVWFPASRYALMASFTGFFGIAGNVLATVPLAALLPVLGWGWSFGVAAAALCVLFAAVLARPGTVPPPYSTSRPAPVRRPTPAGCDGFCGRSVGLVGAGRAAGALGALHGDVRARWCSSCCGATRT